jgi:MFS family permease
MVYQERNTWASLIVTAAALVVYIVVTLQAAAGRALTEVDWVPIMLWTIGASIVASILLSIVWGMLAAGRDPEGVGRSDQRDRDIERAGDRVGQAFLVLGGLGAIALCAVEADAFWIANAVFFGFALSAIVGGVARVIMYRRGLA